MKFYLRFYSFALICATMLFAVTFTGCSGNGDGGEEEIPGALKLSLRVSTSLILPDRDVTFKATCDGKNVLSEIVLMNTTTNTKVENGVWRAGKPGEYAFVATYNGQTTQPQIVTVAGDKQGGFFRHMFVTKFTATWCSPCATLQRTFDGLEKQNPGRIITLTVHSDTADPFCCESSRNLKQQFNVGGYPTCFFNLLDEVSDGGISASAIEQKIAVMLNDSPAVCGVKAVSSLTGTTADVTATVKFEEAGKYRIYCALVENKLYCENGTVSNKTYNHVLRMFQSKLTGNAIASVTQGSELTFDFSQVVDAAWKTENLDFIIYVAKEKTDGVFEVNNATVCPVNGSVEYKYAE